MPFQPKAINGIRGLLGMTQKEFGQALGVSGQTVHNWESGETEPRFEMVDEIYELCHKHKLREMLSLYLPPTAPT